MLLKFNFKKSFAIAVSLFILLLMSPSSFTEEAQAQPPKKAPALTVKRAPAFHQKKFVDSRYKHNRSYLKRGLSVRSLPRGHRVVIHHNDRYYAFRGVWYRHHRGQYVVIAPPVGLFVPFLPFAYATVWMNGIPYYYANETYYTQTPGGYVVVAPPQDEVSETPPDPEDEMVDITDDRMFIYPSKGQSQAQQDNDRYECHKWAVEQTDYDPTDLPYDLSAEDIMRQRKDYRKAMAACLDSRGYSVK
ncbi:MAG: hypothetical protein JW925_03860 [Syntrophaceae bacterium]|nr:hypothetical protein [Syntrophaceae bacterium]